jgi:hypothetical protein
MYRSYKKEKKEMDHTKILKRAWEILKQYRVLWIFGLILALTTASSGSQVGYRFGRDDVPSQYQYQLPENSEVRELFRLLVRWLSGGSWQPRLVPVITFVVVLFLAILALIVIAAIARYVSETSMIRMVDKYEETGEKLRFRQGWKLGWSREAWRLFLIDLAVFFPVFFGVIILFGLAALPLLTWTSGSEVMGAIGTVASIGLFFLVIFVIIVAIALLVLLVRFFRRVCVLEKVGIGDAFRQGYAMVRQNWKDVGVMWLITIGISIGWGLLMIPVVFLLLAAAALLGGAVALLVHGLAGLMMSNLVAWIVAALVGVPVFILVIAIPASFLGGLKEVYMSSTWTLTYRELHALGQLEPSVEPVAPEATVLELA